MVVFDTDDVLSSQTIPGDVPLRKMNGDTCVGMEVSEDGGGASSVSHSDFSPNGSNNAQPNCKPDVEQKAVVLVELDSVPVESLSKQLQESEGKNETEGGDTMQAQDG